jgi:undecaprenyl diphosphate synthase
MIAAAARRLAQEVAAGTRRAEEMSRDALNLAVTDGVPPVDLLIRSAGEQRLSDFMLWEAAYAELVFTPVPWPDFRRDNLAAAVAEFRRRERRFGGLTVVSTAVPAEQQPRRAVG